VPLCQHIPEPRVVEQLGVVQMHQLRIVVDAVLQAKASVSTRPHPRSPQWSILSTTRITAYRFKPQSGDRAAAGGDSDHAITTSFRHGSDTSAAIDVQQAPHRHTDTHRHTGADAEVVKERTTGSWLAIMADAASMRRAGAGVPDPMGCTTS
jgi:hypothetical protein